MSIIKKKFYQKKMPVDLFDSKYIVYETFGKLKN